MSKLIYINKTLKKYDTYRASGNIKGLQSLRNELEDALTALYNESIEEVVFIDILALIRDEVAQANRAFGGLQ
jgi:hypothetical protein